MTSLDWLNIGLAAFGILISGAGFGITLYQVRRTRSAVEATEAATREALKAISSRLTMSEIGDMRGGLRSIQTALRGARHETALIHTQQIIEQLNALRTRAGFESDSRHVSIQEQVVQLAKLRNRLEQKIAEPDALISVPKANNMLSEIAGTLSEWSEELRFNTERNEQ